jgi:hypothetical protein
MKQTADRRGRVGRVGPCESDRREATDGFLFHYRFDAVIARPQGINQSLRLGVARHRDGQIGISRKAWFGTRGNGQAAHQSE